MSPALENAVGVGIGGMDLPPELVQAHLLASHFILAAEFNRGGPVCFTGERRNRGGLGGWAVCVEGGHTSACMSYASE